MGVSEFAGITNLGVGGSASIGETAEDKLTVNATGQFLSPVTIENTLTVGTGTSTLTVDSSGNLTTNGNITVEGTLYTGAQTITGTSDLLTIVSTGNIIMKLGDTQGTNKISIQDASSTEIAHLTSDGAFYLSNSTHGTGSLTIYDSQGEKWEIGVTSGTLSYTNPLTLVSSGNLTFKTTTSTSDLIFSPDFTERMRLVSSSGYLGLATSTPQYLLHVWGSAAFGTSTVPTLYINSSNGRVGIGTTTPTYTLTLVGDTYLQGSVTTTENFTVQGSGNILFNTSGTITFGSSTSTPIVFTGSLQSNLLPYTDNTYDLGSSTYRFRTAYLGTSLVVGSTATLTTNTLTFSGIGNITANATSTWQVIDNKLTIKTDTSGDILLCSAEDLTLQFATTSTFTLYQGPTARLAIGSSGTISLTGNTTINGNATTTANLTVQGNVTVDGDLQFLDNQTITGTGTLTINPTGNLYLQTSTTYIDDSGNVILPGGNYVQTQKIQFTGNITIDASSSTQTTTVIIENSDGTQVANLQIEGDITVTGGKITLASGETIDAETSDQITINSDGLTIIKSGGSEILRAVSYTHLTLPTN